MAELTSATDNATKKVVIDDCWNRIGIRGDRSCAKLTQFVHCHNCDIYADAAKRILDHHELQQQEADAQITTAQAVAEATESILVFRLGEEWLGLPLAVLVEVSPTQVIHSLPHRRSPALQGVSNVRGTLVAVLSLVEILGLEVGSAASGRAIPRMLIIGKAGEGHVVCPVDEVDAVHAIPRQLLAHSGHGKFTRAVFQWQSRSVRLLDEQQLLQASTRSLA